MQEMQYEATGNKLTLLNGLHEITSMGSYAIFIRHADRYKIPEREFGNEIELNEAGFRRSIEYGKALSHLKINQIFSSPIKRCIQTAENIVLGYNKTLPIILTKHLGDPGAFTSDGKLAGESFQNMEFNNLYNMLISGELVRGNRPLQEGASILNEYISINAVPEGVNIFVTHDLIVALYAYAQFGKKYTPGTDWVNYLDGLIIKIETL
ncbi:MAG TPA: histidine phosphatase family protein [Bacteroidales bacterium]|nr:histidine phosphatase family protein [Bacteroidales bacterium]